MINIKNAVLLAAALSTFSSAAESTHTIGLVYGGGLIKKPSEYGLMQLGAIYRIKPNNSFFDLEYELTYLWGGEGVVGIFTFWDDEKLISNVRTDSFILSAYKDYKLFHGLNAFGKLGGGYTNVRGEYKENGLKYDDSSFTPFVAGGFAYKWDTGFSLHLEYQHHFNSNQKAILLGTSYSF